MQARSWKTSSCEIATRSIWVAALATGHRLKNEAIGAACLGLGFGSVLHGGSHIVLVGHVVPPTRLVASLKQAGPCLASSPPATLYRPSPHLFGAALSLRPKDIYTQRNFFTCTALERLRRQNGYASMSLRLIEMYAWMITRSFSDRHQAIGAIAEEFGVDAKRAAEAVDFGMMLDTMPPDMASACLELAGTTRRPKRTEPAQARKRRQQPAALGQ
jgi:hypothetical protein